MQDIDRVQSSGEAPRRRPDQSGPRRERREGQGEGPSPRADEDGPPPRRPEQEGTIDIRV
jgi:hypothetical protein